MRRSAGILLFALLAAGLAGSASAESFAFWSAKAQRSAKAGDDESALAYYGKALGAWKKKDGPGAKLKALKARAGLREKRGEWAAAVEDLGAALKFAPKDPTLLHRRGRAQLELSQPAKAIDDFYKAIGLRLRFPEAYFDRARAYEMQGEAGFAQEDYKSACKAGLKKACSLVKGDKKKAPGPAASRARAAEAARDEEPAKPRAANYKACLKGLTRCIDQGGSFDSCVSGAPACDDDAEPPCCPEACLRNFRRALNDGVSQAQAFRLVFDDAGKCQRVEASQK